MTLSRFTVVLISLFFIQGANAELWDYEKYLLAQDRLKAQEIENINAINNIDDINGIFFLEIFKGHFPIPIRYSVSSRQTSGPKLDFRTHSYFDFKVIPNYKTITLGEVREDYFKRNRRTPFGSIAYYDLSECDDCLFEIPFGKQDNADKHDWYILELHQFEEIKVKVIHTGLFEQVVMIYDESEMLLINDENKELWRASLEFLVSHRY